MKCMSFRTIKTNLKFYNQGEGLKFNFNMSLLFHLH